MRIVSVALFGENVKRESWIQSEFSLSVFQYFTDFYTFAPSLPDIFFEPTPQFIVVGGERGIILSPNRFSGFSGEETVETVRKRGPDVMATLINQGVDSTFLKKC